MVVHLGYDGRRCYEYLFACVKRNKMDSELLLKFIEYFQEPMNGLLVFPSLHFGIIVYVLLGFSWTTFVETAVYIFHCTRTTGYATSLHVKTGGN